MLELAEHMYPTEFEQAHLRQIAYTISKDVSLQLKRSVSVVLKLQEYGRLSSYSYLLVCACCSTCAVGPITTAAGPCR